MDTSIRTANNIIKKYGKEGLKELLSMLVSNISYSEIGDKYGVSRQRVHQWGCALGVRTVTYTVSSEVSKLVE